MSGKPPDVRPGLTFLDTSPDNRLGRPDPPRPLIESSHYGSGRQCQSALVQGHSDRASFPVGDMLQGSPSVHHLTPFLANVLF